MASSSAAGAAAAAGNLTPALEAELDRIDTELAYDDGMADVNSTLSELRAVLGKIDTTMSMSGRCLSYEGDNQRQKQWRLWRERNPEEAAVFSEEEWKAEMDAYGIDGTETTSLKVNSIMVVAAMPGRWDQNWEGELSAEMQEVFRRRAFNWHEFVIVHTGKKYYVYDPSFADVEGEPRVSDVPMSGNRFKKVRASYEKRQKSSKKDPVSFGGGGNVEGDCRKMSLAFVREVIRAIGKEGLANVDMDAVLHSVGGGSWVEKQR